MRAMGGGPHAVRSIYGMRRQAGRAALLGCLVLLAGCASMPSSGEVSKVGSEAHNDADSQVRVYGVKPQKGELAADIVSGFLEATTSNEADYDTAREYLAKGLKKTWQPNRKITILSGGAVQSVQAGSTNSSTTVSLSGTAVAAVDSKHAYRAVSAASKDFSAGIHLSKERGEWRIDSVPDGLVLSEADFLRLYQSVDIYYYASIGQAAVGTATAPRCAGRRPGVSAFAGRPAAEHGRFAAVRTDRLAGPGGRLRLPVRHAGEAAVPGRLPAPDGQAQQDARHRHLDLPPDGRPAHGHRAGRRVAAGGLGGAAAARRGGGMLALAAAGRRVRP